MFYAPCFSSFDINPWSNLFRLNSAFLTFLTIGFLTIQIISPIDPFPRCLPPPLCDQFCQKWPKTIPTLTNFSIVFQFDRVCRLFSEDPTTTQSDEFFGTFDYFISSFEEARQDNETVKKKKEEEEKIAKQHQEVGIFNKNVNLRNHFPTVTNLPLISK